MMKKITGSILLFWAITTTPLQAQIDIKNMLLEDLGWQYSSSIGGSFQSLPTRKNTLPFNNGTINYNAGNFQADTALSLGLCGSFSVTPVISNHFFYQFSVDGSANWLDQGTGYFFNLKHHIGVGYQRYFFIIELGNSKKQFGYNYKKSPSSYSSDGTYNLEVASSLYKSDRLGVGMRIYLGDYSSIYNHFNYVEFLRVKESFYYPNAQKSAGYRATYNKNNFGMHLEYFPKHLAKGSTYATNITPGLPQTGLMFQIGFSKRFNSARPIALP